jgi:hypothetical protein
MEDAMIKTQTISSLVAVACAAAVVAVFWSPAARSQINAAPSWVPIGVSQSGNASTAWFHEPSSRQAVACQTSAQAPNGIHCVTVKLP